MKSTVKLSWFLAFLFICTSVTKGFAQTKDDILNENADITFLGLDFSQTKFIGDAANFGDAGEVTNNDFRDKYIPGWAALYIDEQKKYDISKLLDYKKDIPYDLDITAKANESLGKKDFFSSNLDDYKKLTEDNINGIVKKYNFQGKKGVGMIVFVEGMSKGKKEAGGWVTFVDMGSKKVLLTVYETGKAEGFGFKNYWAKAFYNIVKEAKIKNLK
jgi:hypothetical protein